MNTTTSESLEIQIEALVSEHIAAIRRTAAAAVERAFGLAARGTVAPRRSGPVSKRTAGGPRRAAQEMAGVCERLYEAVCANPGAAMSTLATAVGVSPRELNRPASLLRKAGRLRTAGQRQGTRYFPMAAKTTARS